MEIGQFIFRDFKIGLNSYLVRRFNADFEKNPTSYQIKKGLVTNKNKMSVKLSGTDLFHGIKSGNRLYYNRASSLQINNYDSRKVMLTVRYKFNATRNKYKGSGAGESEKERL